MLIAVSIDNNVTCRDSIDFLKEIRLLGSLEEKKMIEEGETLNINVEVGSSYIGEKLREIGKENVYASIIDEKGIRLFTIDDSNIQCFIPMSNVLSIWCSTT